MRGRWGALVLLPAPFAAWQNGAVGYAYGVLAASLSAWGLWLITGLAAQSARGLRIAAPSDRPTRWDASHDAATTIVTARSNEGGSDGVALRGATLRLLAAFLLKAPILIVIAYGAQSLGTVNLHWCVAGVVLVYFLAVFWAAGQTNRR